MTDDEDLQARLEELETRVAQLELQRELNRAADDTIEAAMRDRRPLRDAMDAMLPVLLEHVEGLAAVVRTFDEDLHLTDFASETAARQFPVHMDEICAVTDRREPYRHDGDGVTILAQHLDVAGELFGSAAVCFEGEIDEDAEQEARELVDTWCEELDNYLASIAQARHAARIEDEIGAALEKPSLEVGIDEALGLLQDHVPFQNLLLVFRHEEDLENVSLQYKIIQDGELTHDSKVARDIAVDEFIRTRAHQMVDDHARDLLERFDVGHGREEILMASPTDGRVLGRLVVTNRQGRFNSHDRDLLRRFADCLRRRVHDEDRAWRALKQGGFPDGIAHRLISEKDCAKWLAPAWHQMAILTCELGGLEEITDPALVGRLVNEWSRFAASRIGEEGGVLDRMEGDRMVAVWGPPFGDLEAAVACGRAATCAAEIREYVAQDLRDGREGKELARAGITLSLRGGLHYGAAIAGTFGPHDLYMAIGAGVDAALELLRSARVDEVVASPAFAKAHGRAERFGPDQSGRLPLR